MAAGLTDHVRQRLILGWLGLIVTAPLGCKSKDVPSGESAPSLAQTRAWIAERLPELGQKYTAYRANGTYEVPGGVQIRTVAASLDATCTLRIEQEIASHTVEFGESRTHSVLRFPLRDVDPSSVRAERIEDASGTFYTLEPYSVVMLSIAGGRELIGDSTLRGETAERKTYARWSMDAQDQNAAERIAKALQRAVELCGGRKEAF